MPAKKKRKNPEKRKKLSNRILAARIKYLEAKVKRLTPERKARGKKVESKTVNLGKLLVKRQLDRKLARAEAAANKAARAFKPRKSDFGEITFVGRDGKRGAELKGRKGFAVYVSKSGKKKVLKDIKKGYGPQKISELKLPYQKRLIKHLHRFSDRYVKVLGGKTINKGSGKVNPSGPYDFSDKVVNKIGSSLLHAFKYQKAQRKFRIDAMILVKKENGETRVYRVTLNINKSDHIAIEQGGVRNWITQSFYTQFARQLSFDGYVTSGSANHVRRLAENRGKDKSKWTKKGVPWQNREDTEQVHIEQIEWKIEQTQ